MKEALKNLPKGWEEIAPGFVQATGKVRRIQDLITPLYTWAKKYQIGLEPTGIVYFDGGDFDGEYWNRFRVDEEFALTEKFFGDGISTNKGGGQFPNGSIRCTSCYRYGLSVNPVNRLTGGTILLCPICTSECDTCQKPIYTAEYNRDDPKVCVECRPVFKCAGCGFLKEKEGSTLVTLYSTPTRVWNESVKLCNKCQEARKCESCEKLIARPAKFVEYEGVKCCPTCHEEKVQKDFEKFEKFRIEELPKGGLIIKSLPARPSRTISIETEVDGNKRLLGSTLYQCGLVRTPDVERYGTATPDDSKWAAFLKHDGSVTGGELISFMLNLDSKEHSDALKVILRKLRALDKAKYIEFNPNCGGHIHIDAHGFGTENIWRLLTVWNYLEDFTYRLAGAGHEYGHRTLVPGHDRANGGHGYANPTVKGPWGIRSSVGQAVRAQDRMCGLNFQPYITAARYCECGAFGKDNGRACKCALPKCTIEWRVWNSQRSPRILHAWIAYMQAVHAYADVDDEPTAEFERSLPTLAWTKRPWNKLTKDQKDAVYTRIEWVFNNLVFTPEERDSLIYAIKQTDISVTPDFEKQLRSIRGVSSLTPVKRAVRKTRYNCRRQKIVIKAPQPGDTPLASAEEAGYRQQIRVRDRIR